MITWDNIVSITEQARQRGVGTTNLANLALFTHAEPVSNRFPEYRAYRNSVDVAKDFGSDSLPARMASKVFSQRPNIKAGDGSLIVIPLLGDSAASPATITLAERDLTDLFIQPSVLALGVNGEDKVAVFDPIDMSSLETIEEGLNAVLYAIGVRISLSGTIASATIRLRTAGVGLSTSLSVKASGVFDKIDLGQELSAISLSATGSDEGEEKLKEAILRTINKVSYFGIMFDEASNIQWERSRLREVASLVQELDKILFVSTNSINSDGTSIVENNFAKIAEGGFTHTRCLFYGSPKEEDCLLFMAAYAGRGLATDYNGIGTAFTMQLKDLAGITADTSIDQTYYDILMRAGVDCYPSFGIAKLATSGANRFFDIVVYETAIKLEYLRLLVNAIATVPTKVPQTNAGVGIIIGQVVSGMNKFQICGILAEGAAWNGEVPVPVEYDIFNLGIMQNGFYSWFDDINNQSQDDREQRITPAGSLSIKFSGAFHKIQSTLTFQN